MTVTQFKTQIFHGSRGQPELTEATQSYFNDYKEPSSDIHWGCALSWGGILPPKLGGENKSAVENKSAMETFPALSGSSSRPSGFKDVASIMDRLCPTPLPTPLSKCQPGSVLFPKSKWFRSDSSGLQSKNYVTPTVQQGFWNKTSEQGYIYLLLFSFHCF